MSRLMFEQKLQWALGLFKNKRVMQLWLLLPFMICSCAHAPATLAELQAVPPPTESFRLTTLQPTSRDRALDRDAVIADLRLALYVLNRASVAQAAATTMQWSWFERALQQVPVAARDVGSFCEALGEALSGLYQSELIASLDGSAVCGRGARAQRALWQGHSTGTNIAKDEARAFRLVEIEANSVFALGVRSFTPESAAWEGFEEALERAARADLVFVDLREASGGDVGRALQLVRTFVNDAPDLIEGAKRRDTAEVDVVRESFAAVLSQLGGSLRDSLKDEKLSRTTARSVRGFSGHIALVFDRGCAHACEIAVAGLNQAPRSHGYGLPTSGRAEMFEPGIVRLPNSGIYLFFPTAHIPKLHEISILSPLSQYFGYVGSNVDVLERAKREELENLALRRKSQELASHPLDPVCPSDLAAPTPDIQSPELKRKVDAVMRSVLSDGGKRDLYFSAMLAIDADSAKTLLEACPGVHVTTHVTNKETGGSLVVMQAPRAVIYWIIRHPAVLRLEL